MNCTECNWSDAYVGYAKVCGYLLQGGETKFIRNDKITEVCPLEDASQSNTSHDGEKKP